MPITAEDIEKFSGELSQKFTDFKSVNDRRIDAISQEKSALAGQVETILGDLKSMKIEKEKMEVLLKDLENKGARAANDGGDPVANEHKEAFVGFVRKGADSGLMELEQKALNMGTDADGGFAMPQEFDKNIIQLERDGTPMRQVARVMTVGTEDYKKLVNLNGAASGWVGEEEARPATGSPKLTTLKPTWGEIYANPEATQKSLDDIYFDAAGWLQNEVALEFSEQENVAFTLGDGSGKPIGFLAGTKSDQADGDRAFGTLQYRETSTSGGIASDDIKRFVRALKAGYRKNASWMMQGETLDQIMLMKDGNGQYMWKPGLDMGVGDTLLGRPVVENEDMPVLAAGSDAIALGDFNRGYYIFDRVGVRVLRDPYTNKPFVSFYTTKRVGSMLADSRAIKLLRIAE